LAGRDAAVAALHLIDARTKLAELMKTLDEFLSPIKAVPSGETATISPPIRFAAIRRFAQKQPENVSFGFFSLQSSDRPVIEGLATVSISQVSAAP
jgi:hypothetical protein